MRLVGRPDHASLFLVVLFHTPIFNPEPNRPYRRCLVLAIQPTEPLTLSRLFTSDTDGSPRIMPPKKAASTSARAGPSSVRSEEPPSEPEHLHDSEVEDESPTPMSKADFRRLLDRLAFLEARELERQAARNPDPVRSKEPKLAPPPEFDGNMLQYRNFMAKVTLTFTLCPRTYPDDESKVLFVISRFADRPLDWAREIVTDDRHPYRHNYKAFKTALDNIYLDRHHRELCEDKLNRLSVTSTVAAYAAEFQPLVEALNWNEESKCSTFYSKLPTDVKTSLAIVGRASTFDALISQAIAVDQRLRQARREKSFHAPASADPMASSRPPFRPGPRESDPLRNIYPLSKPQFQSPRPSPAPNYNSAAAAPSNNQPPQSSSAPTTRPPQPSGPRGPLSEDEKTRRLQKGLCLYCGDPNHIRVNCPSRLAREARVSAMHFHHLESHPEPTERLPEPENYHSQAPPRSEA